MEPRTINGRRPLRREVPKSESLCDYCTAKCCRYVAVAIEEPTNWSDYDDIRWYVSHHNISVFVDGKSWYLLVHQECHHLRADYRCGIYHTRPKICRDYKTKDCEYDSDWAYEKLFDHDDQVFDYAEALLGPNPLHKDNDNMLPVIS